MLAAKIVRSVFTAIVYLYKHKIIYKDLKPENFLLKNKDNESLIILIDFGLAKFSEKVIWWHSQLIVYFTLLQKLLKDNIQIKKIIGIGSNLIRNYVW